MQFTGREDDGTGLYFYLARYYSPSLQRFISEDPIGFQGGINLYAYVANNPLSYTDPLGFDKNPQNADPIGLRDFVDRVKDFLYELMWGAAAEPLAPMMGTLGGAVPRLLPANARTTKNTKYLFDRLEQYHGTKAVDASKRLHDIKLENGFGPADDMLLDLTGNVYHPETLEWLGKLTP